MAKTDSENYRMFEDFIVQTGGTYVFDGETSVKGIGILLNMIRDMGLDPARSADLKKGLFSIFNLDVLNMPDLDNNRFILAPNHVSDADALILGLLHPRIRIVSKDGWTNNAKLRQLLDAHYDLRGLERTSIQSLRRLLADSIEYFSNQAENRHYLVFSQGTISDFNHNSPERVSTIAQKISDRTGVPIIPVFVEQVSLYHTTRIVFDTPITLSKKDNFRAIWLEREKAMQNALVPQARMPRLSDKHANNNKPGDPFF